ncbi:MAG: hypothetical protein WCF23_22135 [Candidatus Nitrosopolaris sp.]
MIEQPARHIKQFLPDPSYGIEIRIVEEKIEETICKTSYRYFLPGFSITDILQAVVKNELQFYYLEFTPSDLQEQIDILLSEGLMERVGEFDHEIRYRFSDPFILGKFGELYDDLFQMMQDMWENLRSP